MSALTDYLASADADERVKNLCADEPHAVKWQNIGIGAALNALCEQLEERDGRHEVQLMRADNLMTQRDEAERKWRHAEGERNALCKRIRELEAEVELWRSEDQPDGGAGYWMQRAKVAEAENERLKEVVGTARAFLDANPALNGTGPLRGDVEAYEQESKPTDVCPRCGGCGEEYPSESVPCSVCGGIGEQEAKP